MKFIWCLMVLVAVGNGAEFESNSQLPRQRSKNQRRTIKSAQSVIASTTVTTERAIHPEIVPREIFKFELSDAKIPDFSQYPSLQTQQKEFEQNVNQQKLTKSEVTRPSSTSQPKKQQTVRRSRQKQVKASERSANISDIQVETDQFQSDASTSESRIMEIVHPSSIPYEPVRGRTVKNLPFSVQKAISHALKQDYNIPYLDTIKYYLKDPAVRIPNSKLSSLDSHLKPWWQTSSNVKINSESTSFTLSPQRLLPINTTPKPLISTSSISPPAPFPSSEYVTYPLLRGYPIHYSPMNSPLNDASGNNNGISFLYGDRIYSKIPYNLGTKSSVSSNLNDVISNVEPITEIQSSTPNSLTSTSPIVFPPMVKTTISSPTKIPEKSYVHYYSAEESVKDAQNGVLLSNDKNTLNLITKAVNAIKKHNPHLDVVPKRIENDELIVHVTPKPEYFITPTERVKSTLALDGDKNHAYLTNGPVLSKQKTAKVVNHHYLKQIHVPAHHDDLHLETGYAFGYRVRDHSTGNDFGHQQKRMVDGTTHGEYKILMPDGRVQNVKYKADEQGYRADVTYEE